MKDRYFLQFFRVGILKNSDTLSSLECDVRSTLHLNDIKYKKEF